MVTQANDPDSDNEFWDNTKKVYDIFKEELHPTQDYSWMWEQYIQPGLLSSLSAIVEDTSYLSENSKLVDRLPSVLKSNVEILQPFVKREWKKSTNKDTNRSVRITFNYNEKQFDSW